MVAHNLKFPKGMRPEGLRPKGLQRAAWRAALAAATLWAGLSIGLWGGAALAGVPTPAIKPEWVSRPLAVQLGLVTRESQEAVSETFRAGDEGDDLLSATDRELYGRAFAAAKKRRWKQALRLAAEARDPLPGKVIEWMWIVSPGTDAGFERISRFIEDYPDWPLHRRVQAQAERQMDKSVSDARVLAWFRQREPITGWGRVRLAGALIGAGEERRGTALLRKAWAENDFTREQVREIRRRLGKLLRRADHIARIDRLIWNRKRSEARSMLSLVGKDYRRVAEARLALMRKAGNVDSLIARVPQSLQRDPGLLFERTRWRRRADTGERAREFLLNPPADLVRPDRWWTERSILVRKALAKGHFSDAYRMVKDHRLKSGVAFAEAEWLAGWIALTFLRDAEVALEHFNRLHDGVRFPVSKARAAYWSGRAADALGRPKLARKWYLRARSHKTTFYGQMASLRLDNATDIDLPPDPEPTAREIAEFVADPLVRVVRQLAELRVDGQIRRFILALNAAAETPGQHALVAALGVGIGRPDLAVLSAKRSMREGILISSLSYPEIPLIQESDTSLTPLLHAVLRQESQFNPYAVSSAGARGLMQLMPQTARRVARRLKVRFTRTRLLTDPTYNIRLGGNYLEGLVRKYNGSYPLALAAYNAGEGRVRQWIRLWGDPRRGEIDTVDWIELIPFSETRNYVQRVLEGLQVYRSRLAGSAVALGLNDDLNRDPAETATAASGCSC